MGWYQFSKKKSSPVRSVRAVLRVNTCSQFFSRRGNLRGKDISMGLSHRAAIRDISRCKTSAGSRWPRRSYLDDILSSSLFTTHNEEIRLDRAGPANQVRSGPVQSVRCVLKLTCWGLSSTEQLSRRLQRRVEGDDAWCRQRCSWHVTASRSYYFMTNFRLLSLNTVPGVK